ncbi:hypothetical protein CRENPOLYSF1_890020 [Crenothrix polyspora]|uniref:Uncharacterized protein n=1 Tax=Crenothrix polyspora TaxID=360316 RepID=A0A1R4HKC5_9GAMM|nr:hypothetical protein CRENPOLYSF1_890020 [Crenothrix polyspora]
MHTQNKLLLLTARSLFYRESFIIKAQITPFYIYLNNKYFIFQENMLAYHNGSHWHYGKGFLSLYRRDTRQAVLRINRCYVNKNTLIAFFS